MSAPSRARGARGVADGLGPWTAPERGWPGSPSRVLVMGDPQAPADTIFAILERHDALGDDGYLADDVVLVSIGDHFDFDPDDPSAGEQGRRFLRWLAAHDPRQAVILLGNHDAVRVMELIGLDDATFTAARGLARSIAATQERDGRPAAAQRIQAEFYPTYPQIPVLGMVGRDFASYCISQRALVMELLLGGRIQLAAVGAMTDGREVLLTHAGVTTRELAMLGLDDAASISATAIADALNRRLADAVDECRADWERGGLRPLSLAPLHVVGEPGVEGGGLLYHRPARRDRDGADVAKFDPERPRRFDPLELPVGLLQVAGHTGHHKCCEELGDGWVSDAARQRRHGGLRTLRVDGDQVVYDLGIAPAAAGVADLYMVDGEMRRVPAAEVPLLELAALLG